MRKKCLASLMVLLAGAGLGLAQPPVLASPAPHARAGTAGLVMPSELPPITDATTDGAAPALFPLPGAVGQSRPAPAGVIEPGQGGACPAPRFRAWASGEPLLWFVSPAGGLDYGPSAGGRVAAGLVKPGGDLGVEVDGLLPGRATAHAGAAGSSSQVWGAEANLLGGACGNERFGLDVLGGLRYLALDEDLGLTQAAGAGGATEADSFRTRNQFFGGQFGSQMEVRWGRLYTNLLGKVAVGNVHQVVDVRSDPAPTAGLLAAPGGGRQTHDEFGVVPEVNINVGYQVRPCVRLYAGYSFLYLSDVARAGDQVGPAAIGAQVPAGPPGAAGPLSSGNPLFNRSDFWAQGINFGLAVRY